jgi:hypothetical protein
MAFVASKPELDDLQSRLQVVYPGCYVDTNMHAIGFELFERIHVALLPTATSQSRSLAFQFTIENGALQFTYLPGNRPRPSEQVMDILNSWTSEVVGRQIRKDLCD